MKIRNFGILALCFAASSGAFASKNYSMGSVSQFKNDGGSRSFQYPFVWFTAQKDHTYISSESLRPEITYMKLQPGQTPLSHPKNKLCKALSKNEYPYFIEGTWNHKDLKSVIDLSAEDLSDLIPFQGHYINRITCAKFDEQPDEKSTRYKYGYENTDGTVTLVEPRSQYLGFKREIVVESDRNGVCKLFGLGEAAPLEHPENQIDFSKKLLVEILPSGHPHGFGYEIYGRKEGKENPRKIAAITCKWGALRFPLKEPSRGIIGKLFGSKKSEQKQTIKGFEEL